MHTAVRPFATSGVVALVGAGFIAATPIVAPPLATKIEHAATQLAATSSPFSAYSDVFADTVKNLQGVFATAQANGPAPILSAVFHNQIAAIQDILDLLSPAAKAQLAAAPNASAAAVASAASLPAALQATLGQIFSGLTAGAPPLLASAIQDLLHGNVETAVNQVLLAGLKVLFPLTNLIAPALDGIANPLQGLVNTIDKFGPLATILANPVQNVVNVLHALNEGFLGLPSPTNAVTILGGLLGPLIQVPAAAGAAVQGIIDAARQGNIGAVLKAVISVPAVVIGGILNGGYGPDLSSVVDTGLGGIPVLAGGLLTQFGFVGTDVLKLVLPGAIPALQTLQKLIADALKPPTVTKASAAAAAPTAAVSTVPDPAATTVTLATADTKSPTAQTPTTVDTPKDPPKDTSTTKPAAADTVSPTEPATDTSTDTPTGAAGTDETAAPASPTTPDTKGDNTSDTKADPKADSKGDTKGDSSSSGTGATKPSHVRGPKHSDSGKAGGSQSAGGADSAGTSSPKHAHHSEHAA